MLLSILMTVFKFLSLSSFEAPFFRCFFCQQIFPHETLAVQHGGSITSFPLRGHLQEGYASRLAALPMAIKKARKEVV